MQSMYYIGLDVHKRTISYCVKDGSGTIHDEGTIPATRFDLDRWMKTLPQPWTAAMEATVFTGWIYDHLQPHAAALKVAHPLMLRAIAAAKKKNDRIDANKICDCLRCDFLPECYMASTAIRERRRTLRYRNLLVRQMVQMKKMVGKLSPKSQRTYIGYAKQIRKSLIDDEGKPIYPITWNNDFIDLPPAVKREQRRGKLSAEEIEKLIASEEQKWVHAVFVLCAASGMRIAEILAIDIGTCLPPDCSMILVKQQVKASKVVEYLKADAAHRIVDLCPEAAEYLREFVRDRKGLLFPSRKGTTPVSYKNFLKRYLTPSMKKLGVKELGKAAHAFRRFRSSILAKSGVEEDIRKFWLGHENNDITAQYAEQIREDNSWRQTLAAKVGLGFQIQAFVPKPIVRNVRKNRQASKVAMAS